MCGKELDSIMFSLREEKFTHPSSTLISGVSMSGKSTFVKSLIKNVSSMYFPNPTKVIISYSVNPEQYSDLKNVQLVQGLDFDTENFLNEPTLIVIDDQMTESGGSKKIQDLFTKGVHHRNQSVIFITQNIYNQGKFARDLRLNLHYMIFFKSPTFLSQIMCLSRQVFPESKNFLTDAYKKATEKPYSYLFLNLHPNCPDILRVRSGILPNEEEVIYTP